MAADPLDVEDLRSAAQRDSVFVERALESAGLGVFEYDAVTRNHRLSSRCRQIWGLSPEEPATLDRLHQLIHPDDRSLEGVVAASLDPPGSGEFSIEHRIVRPDGKVRWVLTRGQTIFEGHGETRHAVRSVGTMLDVTDRRRTELLLQTNAQTFYHLIKNNPFGIYVIDSEFRLVEVSKGAHEVFRNIVPLLGRDFAEVLRTIWIEPFATDAINRFRHTLATGEPYGAPSTVERRADLDKVEAYDWRIERISMPDGRPGVVCYFYDLSERQQLEAEVRDRERRLRQVIDSMFAFVGVVDPDGTLVETNRAPLEVTGLKREDVIGVPFWDCPWWTYDDSVRDRVRGAFNRAVAGEVVRYDETMRVANNQLIAIDFMLRPVIEDGRLKFLISSAVDVTSRREAEVKLRDADRRKDAFLATLSHELRNPLAPIRNAAQLLATPHLSDESLSWARQVIQRQVGHLALLLDDLLDVARITQGKLVLKKTNSSLRAIVDSAVEAARPLINNRRHTLSITLPPDALRLACDQTRLAQVITNLLTNAAKYTDRGGRIALHVAHDAGGLHIAVGDNGIGLPAEALPQLFTMFSQVDGTAYRSEGGLGIGLALVKGLVDLHGGSVAATSDGPGRGSEFVVHLPAELLDTAHAAAVSQPSVGATSPKRRILVADDNRDAAETLAQILRLQGHEVRVAHDGEAALAIAQEFEPDIALLDIGMPKLDGYEVARNLREQGCGKPLVLIAITGWGQEEDRRKSLAAGFDRHLTKPVDPEQVEGFIRDMCAGAPRQTPAEFLRR